MGDYMRITLRNFVKEFQRQGCSLKGWGLKFDTIDLLVVDVSMTGDVYITQPGGFKHVLKSNDWFVVGVKPKSMLRDRNTLLVR